MHNEDIQALRKTLALRDLVDEIIEEGLKKRHNLALVIQNLLPQLSKALSARGAFVQSYGEDLALEFFAWPNDLVLPRKEEILAKCGAQARQAVAFQEGPDLVVACPLDVIGDWFGVLGVVVPCPAPAAASPEALLEQLHAVSEELDNFLVSIRASREKHRVMMELNDALRHRVLGEGVRQAVRVLSKAISIDRLLLLYVAEEAAEDLHLQLFRGGEALLDTLGPTKEYPGATLGEETSTLDMTLLLEEARAYLRGESTALLARLGFVGAQEEVLINGITHRVVVGKLVVTPGDGSFNTYDRELLSGFAGFIRQRVVDFNKEWRRLAASFCPQDVARLLGSDDYERRFLAPREEEVAILYTDIAGFTRLSEQVLKSPSAVAALVEHWGREAVRLVWEYGGVFDKMVGDCVIALFGPPFYDQPPGERLRAALRCAAAIRDMTKEFPARQGFEILREKGIGVATGVNLCPLFVGCFGPNRNFTGFSSGMNNTARLQGCARRDEILVMSAAIEALPEQHGFLFGEEQEAVVKNVAAPLRFRALKSGP